VNLSRGSKTGFLDTFMRPQTLRSGCLPLTCGREHRYLSLRRELLEKHSEITRQKKQIDELTARDRKNAVLFLRMQAEDFFTRLELDSLRRAVEELKEQKRAEEHGLEEFSAELKRLEENADRQEKPAPPLDYELSQEDWSEIVGS